MSNILYSEQQPISNDIYKNLEKCELFNVPTGRGKTFILLDVAKRVISENKKEVIISVPNNYLVREMAEVAKSYFGFSDKNCGIKIGIENYVDIERLKLFISISEKDNSIKYFDLDDAKNYITKHKNTRDLFFEDFFKEVPLEDIALETVIRHNICRLRQKEEDKPFKALTITNHYYLLSKSLYSNNFDIGDYTVLIDEVHEIADVAEQIMTDSFSFFEYKNILQAIKKKIHGKEDFHGKQKILKSLQNQVARAHRALKKQTKGNLVGQYVTKGEDVVSAKMLAKKILESEEHQYIGKKVSSLSNEFEKYFNKTNNFTKAVSSWDKNTNNILYGVYYSPSKGYPTLRTSSGNPLGKIHNLFWDKIKSFAGVSGSTTCSFSPTIREVFYGYYRLGMAKENDKRRIHFYERLFPKEKIGIHFVEKDFYKDIQKESVYDENFNPDYSPYYEKIISRIHDTHEGENTIVLCGGYKESEYLATLYEKKYGDTSVLYSNTLEKVYQTIENFKERGGILFATKNYGLGTSLKGKLLEKLYLLKFPYPDYTTKKWQEIRSRSNGLYIQTLEREMLITFMQNLGRIARTKDDEGDIHILDYNYPKMKSQNKTRVEKIAQQYGTIAEKKKSSQRPKAVDIAKKMEELF